MEKICGIYKITSPTGKIYIGQSNNIARRWRFYMDVKCKTQTRLYRSLLKYGSQNHVFEILEECDKNNLDELEIKYIDQFNSFDTEHGLNLRSGGMGGGRSSVETGNRISNSRLGKKHGKNTSSKFVGVSRTGNNWKASITYRCTSYNLGFFNTEESASAEYKRALASILEGTFKNYSFIIPNRTSKFTGVYYHKINRKYCANIEINRKIYSLGSFISEEDAGSAYRVASLHLSDGTFHEYISSIKKVTKGYCWHKSKNKWRTTIRINGKPRFVGYYTTEIDASNAYKDALKKNPKR